MVKASGRGKAEGKIALGSDHAGVGLKAVLRQLLEQRGITPVDLGTEDSEPVDYPDYGERVAGAVSRGKVSLGILVCGSGIGMSIVANKFPGVRAALCHDPESARLSREHNDSNVLVLGERKVTPEEAVEIATAWLDAAFAGGRHARRVDKIRHLEKRVNHKSRKEKG